MYWRYFCRSELRDKFDEQNQVKRAKNQWQGIKKRFSFHELRRLASNNGRKKILCLTGQAHDGRHCQLDLAHKQCLIQRFRSRLIGSWTDSTFYWFFQSPRGTAFSFSLFHIERNFCRIITNHHCQIVKKVCSLFFRAKFHSRQLFSEWWFI